MRLLKFDHRGELSLTEDLQDGIPPDAILSHTWGDNKDEVNFDDLKHESYKNKAGYNKMRFCGEQAQRDKLEYFWVDTCCIRCTEVGTKSFRTPNTNHYCGFHKFVQFGRSVQRDSLRRLDTQDILTREYTLQAPPGARDAR
jgi:hypothetical protein